MCRVGASGESRAVRRRIAGVLSAVVLGVVVLGANGASADEIQIQSYQRASQGDECLAQLEQTPWKAAWGSDDSWHPSWEQWANGGQGGWTCTRSITWAKDPVASGPTHAVYRVGDIGPGGGLVFYIDSGTGLRYEMAPSAWGAGETGLRWCHDPASSAYPVPGATGTAIGTGKLNTEAMAGSVSCNSDVALAALAYPGSDSSAGQWFLPSKDELNAFCYYTRYLVATQDPTASCFGISGTTQNPALNPDYAFTNVKWYWSSTQNGSDRAVCLEYADGTLQSGCGKRTLLAVRPIRSF